MNFSRLRYDDDTYVHTLKESIGPGDYMISTPHNNCEGCSFYAPGVNLDRTGAAICDKELIDVDSELLGITRKASECPGRKYLPSAKPFCEKNMEARKKECDFLTPEHTLISNPKCTGKESTANRWEWLCQDPQDKSLVPFDYLINNRLVVKDAHRPCIPSPIDQEAALPPKCNQFVKYDWSSRYNQPRKDIPGHQLAYCGNIPLL